MTESSDDILANAGAFRDRLQNRELVAPARVRRRRDTLAGRVLAIGAVNAAILIVAAVVGLVFPLGIFGALAVLILMVAATCAIAFAPTARAPSLESLKAAPVKQLPSQTARWLHSQRAALPAPAITLADRIGARLQELEPQLANLDPETPAAAEVRKLVGEQLPDFVKGYTAVPSSLRAQPRNGQTPDAQLVDGLKVIDEQLADMSAQLAQGDLDNFATRGRYLQIRYQGDDES
jgi:hypothetical protein